MRISTLSIGDELICGEVMDSNASTLARELIAKGLRVLRHITVGDSELDIMSALADLRHISDVIIATGGLGPTVDDLTTHAAARATGRRLVVSEEAKAHVRHMSGKLTTLIFCPLSDKQSMIPAKTTLIPNPNGTACGFQLMHNGCFMFFLPGVPLEMERMLHDSVLPFLAERMSRKRNIRSLQLNVFGPCEAEVNELLVGISRPEQGLQMGICVSFPWIQITLRADADSEEGTRTLLVRAAQAVRERLHEHIFSEGTDTLDEVLAVLIRQSGLTLAVAESCSGGMIAQRITDVPGSSGYFLEGQVTYSNSAKERLLDVPVALIDEKGAVSSEVAKAMAKGVRRVAGSDLGLAVTGIAGPEGGSEDKPVGTVFISLAAPDGCWTKRFQFSGSRNEIRVITSWTALDWLRRYLLTKIAA